MTLNMLRFLAAVAESSATGRGLIDITDFDMEEMSAALATAREHGWVERAVVAPVPHLTLKGRQEVLRGIGPFLSAANAIRRQAKVAA